MRDTGIAARLRAAGIPVVEVAGWQTRGSETFNPKGSINHHTAGPARGATPSLNTVIYGRPDLPGPLCHVLQSREADGTDKAYVVAAGRANHAGAGGWKGLSGNSSVYGLEIEHVGTEPLPLKRQQIAARIHAAMFDGNPAMVAQHREWAPSRKIDAATGVDPGEFRAMVLAAKPQPTPPPPPTEDDDMPKPLLVRLSTKHVDVLYMSSARTVHWVRSADALKGYQIDMQMNGLSPDVCVLDVNNPDENLASLYSFVINLPFIGDWPEFRGSSTGTKEAWKGPYLKADPK